MSEKKCGACAMVVSGRPALACAVSLGAAADSSGEITLEPLRKFPRIRDLQVDRGACFAALQEMELWLEEEADLTNRARRELHYRAAGCLMCGLCLEVCPHFSVGGPFVGAMGAAAAFRVYDQSAEGGHRARGAPMGGAFQRLHQIVGLSDDLPGKGAGGKAAGKNQRRCCVAQKTTMGKGGMNHAAFGHENLCVSNLEASIRFYEEMFGLSLMKRLQAGAGLMAWLGDGEYAGLFLELTEGCGTGQQPYRLCYGVPGTVVCQT